MLKSSIVSVMLCLSLIGNVSAMVVGDPSKAKNDTCAACHGPDGNSPVSMWPKIAGQHEQYLFEQLKELSKPQGEGLRFEPTMYPMVQNLSEQELADLAAFYASQKMSPGKTPESYVELGEKLYRGGDLSRGISACIACHGPKGLGNELAKYPRLSGQNVDYTITQLKKYRSGERKTDPNAIMRNIASKMSDEEIEAVSHYVSGLH